MTDADPKKEVETLRERIETGERGGSEADREVLLDAADGMALRRSEVGAHRRLKILRHGTRMAEECGGLAEALNDRDAAEEIVRWIHREYDNEHTNQDYRTALRSIGRYARRREEPPEALQWIPTGTSNDFDPTPSERDLLRWEDDVKPMLNACQNSRDRALIAVQFEAGLRGGELYDLAVGDVFESEHTTGLHVDGKEGERPVHLRVSLPHLQRWLDDHPERENADAPLWAKLNRAERSSYTAFLDYFNRAADRAGVDKPVTPTNFRKSNTRWLVTQGVSAPRIEDRQGRQRGSDHTARYLARFGAESNEAAYLSALGEDVKTEDPDEVTPITCPRCDRETPRDRGFCMWCDFALSPEATEGLEETRRGVVDWIAEADDATEREMGALFMAFLEDHPHLLPEDAHERVTSTSSSSSS